MTNPLIKTSKIKATTNVVVAFFISIVLFSCNGNSVYKDYEKIPDRLWNKDYQTSFEFEIEDTSQRHQVDILIRNAGMYPFSNLWIFIHQTSPDGYTQTDTLECILADEAGKWLGDGMGDIWDNEILWRRNYKFPQTGKYTYSIEHAMRTDILPGIMDVGLNIKKQEK